MRSVFCTAVFGVFILHSGLCAATADTIVSDTAPSGAPSASPPAGYADGDFLYQHYVPQADDPQQNGLYYRLFLPRNYATSGAYQHPLVIFHHGDGEKENSNPPRNQRQLSNNGQYNFCSVANQAEFPCFVAMVQAGWWGRDASGQQTGPGMVAALARQYRINPRWVIVTGLSGGGGATLSWAGQRPDAYAGYVALSAPSPGDAGSYQPMKLATIPGWFFGSRSDSIDVNPSTVRDIRMFGGNPALTVYDSGGHSSTTWNAAYSTPALYQWLKSLEPGQTPTMPVDVEFTAPAATGPHTTTSATATPAGTTRDNRIDGASAGVSAVSWYTAADAPGLDGETALGASAATGTATWTASGSRTIPAGDTSIVATATGSSLHPTQTGFTCYSKTLAIHRDGAAAQELDLALGSQPLPDAYRISVASGSAGSATPLSFVLTNSGGTALTVTPSVAITYPTNANCTATVTTAPPSSIAAGATAPLTISVTPTVKGVWEFRLAITSDDADEGTYNLSISGNAGLATGPELGVTRSGAISDGGTDSVAGSAPGVAAILTYALANSGSGALAITTPVAISGASNCTATVTTHPSTPVAAGGSTSLVVSVTPTAVGAWSFAVSVANDDADESPYNWTASGTAASPAPELDIARGATAVADGGSDTLAGSSVGTAATLSYALTNSGSAALGVTTPVTVSGASNCSATVTTQPSTSVAAGGASPLVVSVTPTAAGAWSFAVSVANTDADEGPYDWTVSGTAGGSTQVVLLDIGSGTASGDVPPRGGTTSGNWNNITESILSVADCIDATGAASGISVAASGFPGWPVSTNGVYDSTLFPATAQSDFFTISSGGGTITFGNLDSSSTYDVEVFASRMYTSATTSYTIGGSTQDLACGSNTGTSVTFPGLSTTGTIALQVAPASGSSEGLIGAVRLTRHAGTSANPELDVSRSGALADGGSDTVTGSVAASATTLTYTLANSGTAALGVTTPVVISGASNCVATVTTQPGASIAAGGTSSLVVSVTPTAAGAWSFAVSVANTDADEDPYDWTVSGTATAVTAPELDVSHSGALADGGSDAVTGSVAASATTLTYTLANSGTAALGVTTPVVISGASNCVATVTTQPGASIAAGGTSSLVVSVTPTAAGAWSFAVSVANTDSDENPYDWTVSGTATAVTAPELDVNRSGALADGGSDGVTGSVAASATMLTYTLANSGTAALGVTTPVVISGASNCVATVTTQPGTSIAAGGTSGLVVSVTPTTAAAWSFTVSVASTDADENPYTWTVGGTAGGDVTVDPDVDAAHMGSSGGCGAGSTLGILLAGAACMLRRRRGSVP